MEILDGKGASDKILQDIMGRVNSLRSQGVVPKLVFFLIGEQSDSARYVTMKQAACRRVSVDSEVVRMSATVDQQKVLEAIQQRNMDPAVHGIMAQLRLPDHMDERTILQAIDPLKDVDGLTEVNQEDPEGEGRFAAATAKGVLMLLEQYDISLTGQRVVILGRTNLFGVPFKKMVEAREPAWVGFYGRDWEQHLEDISGADVVVSALGGGRILIRPEMVKDHVACIDVGLGPDFDVPAFLASDKKGWITPTKGGTGPMTVAAIVLQTVIAAERQING